LKALESKQDHPLMILDLILGRYDNPATSIFIENALDL